jgi:hypothetical protein
VNRRRRLRLALIVVVALVAVTAVGLAALPQLVRQVAVRRLAATTGRAVTLDAVELSLFRGHVALRGLRVMDRDGSPLATLDRLEARLSPRDALRGRVHLVDGALDGLTVRIVRTGPREFNISDLLVRKPDRGAGPSITTTIDRFSVRNVAAVIEDRTLSPSRTWRVELEADAQDVSTLPAHRPGVASLRGTVAGAPLSLTITDLRLAPLRLRATFTARDLDASLASLALPAASPVSPARGTVSASGTIAHDAAGSLIALDVGFKGIELERYHTAFLVAPAVRVTVENLRVNARAVEVGRVGVDGGTVTLADAQLGTGRRWQVDGVTLEARNLSSARTVDGHGPSRSTAPPGTASASATMAGARVSLWAANVRLAPLELHATTIIRNVDLAVMRAYLPPSLPVLPERGVVNATLRIDHDEGRGTRLGLDAGLSGIELRRPGHVVTAPAFRVVAEDIAIDRGTVTIGHVTAGSDRLTLEERGVSPVRTWAVQNLVVEAKTLSSRRTDVQGVASLQATVAGAAVSAWVTRARLDPLELHVTTSLRNFDLALLRLYLPPEALVELTRGVVNGAFEVDHTVAGGTRVTGDATLTDIEARGRWRLSTMSASAPSLRVTLADVRRHDETLSVGRVELSGSGSIVDGRAATSRIDLAQLRVASEGLTWPVRAPARVELSARFGDRGELDASGTAQLTAPLPRIAWSAELALAFRRVDLTPLGVYVAAARGVGGQVRANVTATVDYADRVTARVRGDVVGGRFALVDGDRTLLSLRRIDATGLDVQWPERVAIAQVRLRQPSVLLERDREGRFPLLDRFAPAAAETTPALATGEARPRVPPVMVGEVVVENGSVVIVDHTAAATRVEVPRVDLTVRDATWPKSSTPARVALHAGLPGGGTAKVEGTIVGEPASVDLTVALTNADVARLQAFFPFRAGVRARVDATLAVAGPILPTPRVSARGEATVRNLAIADGQKPVMTVERIGVTGIDAVWPERVTLDRVRVRKSWALIERDRQGDFLLRHLLERSPAAGGTPTAAPPGPPRPEIALGVREMVLEEHAATIIDAIPTPTARFDVAGARLVVQDMSWPSRGPLKLELASPMPGGGRINASGTFALTPLRIDGRVALDGVAIDPAQPYLPIEGRVGGLVTGDVAVKIAREPVSTIEGHGPSRFTVRITGQARVQRFRLSDGDRPVMTVGRAELTGIDADWPRRIAVERVLFRGPRLLVERDPLGQIRLWRVAVPNWTVTAPADGPATLVSTAPAAPSRAAPAIDVATVRLERASARFVDQSTTPTYAEELSDVEMTAIPLTTVPGRRTRFTASGGVGGGSFKARGEVAAGDRTHVELTVDLRDFIVPRANPYLDLYTGWTATRGSLSATGAYTVNGTRLETRHDVVVRDLDVEPVDTRDEVARRVGLPFGLLVSLLKDSRGAIKLSVPVAGDLSTREFEFQDALWGGVRALALRLVALPFSRIGSLFVSEDSKVEAVAIRPVAFEPGTSNLVGGMDAHLQKIAGFLRDAPAVTLALEPIFTQADADALKAEGDPSDAMRALGEHRLGIVRDVLLRAGIDTARLQGRVPRRPLIEAAGASRVELNPRPGGA